MDDNLKVLQDYDQYEETKSCFLDGRYINVVLASVPEFVLTPIDIRITFDKNGKLLMKSIGSNFIKIENGINIIRVRIKSNYVAHSALLWINTKTNQALYTDVISRNTFKHLHKVQTIVDELIEQYLNSFGDYIIKIDRMEVPDVRVPGCKNYGFCNAYVIKQVFDYVNGDEFDPTDILRFAAAIEDNYYDLLDPNMEVEEEYIIGGLGLGLGLLGGVALGSALAGPRYYPYPAYGYPYYY